LIQKLVNAYRYQEGNGSGKMKTTKIILYISLSTIFFTVVTIRFCYYFPIRKYSRIIDGEKYDVKENILGQEYFGTVVILNNDEVAIVEYGPLLNGKRNGEWSRQTKIHNSNLPSTKTIHIFENGIEIKR
jgi:hypothetical protein